MNIGAGTSLKPQHFAAALASNKEGLWFEIHPENYFVEGGPRLHWLEAIRQRHPLSVHGVALSLAAEDLPDAVHLGRLAALVDRLEPALVSEHLAWATWDGRYFPDLLPFPRSTEALLRIIDNVQRTQECLGRRIAVENPSHYLALHGHDWSETDFLAELSRRSGCALLLDLNNVVVSAHNLAFDARQYLAEFPWHAVVEIHLAGHAADEQDAALLVDSHDRPVSGLVWELYQQSIALHGPIPTLLERDGNVPGFDELMVERARAQRILDDTCVVARMRLREFQSAFAAALHADTPFAPAALRGFRVYRNTVMQGCIEALRANFPTVEQLVGAEWFGAVAADYARLHPPTHPSLMYYGDGLADLLQGLDASRELPYLPGIARLDMFWLRAHAAANEEALATSQLAGLSQQQLGDLSLRPHASARWAWFEAAPVFTIWDAHRRGLPVPSPLQWREEGALLVRSAQEVGWFALDRPSIAFLDACRSGRTLGEASDAGNPDGRLAQRFAALLAAGAFTAIH